MPIAAIELEKGALTVVTGPSINPVVPATYEPILAADGVHTYIAGAAYCGALWKSVSSVLTNTGNLAVSFDLNPDAALIQCAQALEFDSRPTDAAGYTYPMDFQFNIEENWMLQLSVSGTWTDTGIRIPPLVAGQWTNIQQLYTFNITAKTFSWTSIAMDGTVYTFPGSFNNQAAVSMGWTINQLVLQKQIDLNSGGGAGSDIMRNLQAIWS